MGVTKLLTAVFSIACLSCIIKKSMIPTFNKADLKKMTIATVITSALTLIFAMFAQNIITVIGQATILVINLSDLRKYKS